MVAEPRIDLNGGRRCGLTAGGMLSSKAARAVDSNNTKLRGTYLKLPTVVRTLREWKTCWPATQKNSIRKRSYQCSTWTKPSSVPEQAATVIESQRSFTQLQNRVQELVRKVVKEAHRVLMGNQRSAADVEIIPQESP
eukprot:6017163-Amphidinium_carterae.1